MAADCSEADTQVIGQIQNFLADKNWMGTAKENREFRHFMAGPQEHLRTRLSVPPGYRKRSNGLRGTTLSLLASAQSACARSSWLITFVRPRENRTNHDIFKFAASGPIAQKQLKKPDGSTYGMIKILHRHAFSEILLIKT